MDFYCIRYSASEHSPSVAAFLAFNELFATRAQAEGFLRGNTTHHHFFEVGHATWQQREQALLSRELNMPPVWDAEKFWQKHRAVHEDHYAHISQVDPAMIAFTESPEKGERGIQARMKPGRYRRPLNGCCPSRE